ncbi:DUF2935 domain-containing protein [Aneurinibacillus sp. Ricciae_BoGa-3]|uniref:DUF2935 domain-containing protein n=1 Tax=Aneurinibacillus sp. Ricciae_BoGa-3 TaxID=3022697 RepID=UPI00234130C9|nr:DUF2935 domain-containing protein [Aneurinibacillus sp. Ricciae_BoGa-3]WCK54443.1 DUF2935 domain-containing protein [Aneurinibacillus sp. Ricciae_BoGa-3]
MTDYQDTALFEHRFWLQILGDHARFIQLTLAVKEQQEIAKAAYFIQIFDNLLSAARQLPADDQALDLLTRQAYAQACQLRAFKLHLLSRHLIGKIDIQLPPTFMNHMVNELDEYIRILSFLLNGQTPPACNPVYHHLLWLLDAVGHASTITCSVDIVENDIKEKSNKFIRNFEHLFEKAVEFAGYLRTNIDRFPALSRLNRQAELEMIVFLEFLNELEEMKLTDQLLGVLNPLMPDHMAREECYYLTKLSEVSEVEKPTCMPDKPRVE